MSDLLKYKWILTGVGFVLILLISILTSYYRDNSISVSEEVFITNVTDTAFTVIWTSDEPYVGELVYQEAEGRWLPYVSQFSAKTAYDDRDLNSAFYNENSDDSKNSKFGRYSHHITVGGLTPETSYNFRVKGWIIGKNLNINTATTKPLREELSTPDPAYGSLQNVAPRDSIIITSRIDTPDTLISTPVALNRTYSVDLAALRLEGAGADSRLNATDLNTQIISEANVFPGFTYNTENTNPFETVIMTTSGIETKESPIQQDTIGTGELEPLVERHVDRITGEYSSNTASSPASDLSEDFVAGLPSEYDGLDDNIVTGDPTDLSQQAQIFIDVPRDIYAGTQPTERDTTNPNNNDQPYSEPSQPTEPHTLPVCIASTEENFALYHSPRNQNIDNRLVKKANAQTSGFAGSDAPYMEVADPGRIAFFESQDRVAEKDIILNTAGNSAKIRLYYDDNGNGKKDEFEEYMEDYDEISYAAEATAIEYKLNAGWNLINIPMIDTREDGNIDTAKKLIDYWDKQGTDIKHVARFLNGRFEFASKRESGKFYSGDFTLIPGEAIFVFSLKYNATVTFSGNEYTDSVPISLTSGWNLVGVVSPGKNYTSETIITAMEEEGIMADTISQYENGIYTSVVKEQGIVFGNNFNLARTKGYFIKVEQGSTQKFTP